MLTRSDVANLLSIDECIPAVEHAFALHAEGKAPTPKVLGIHSEGGGFHIKAGILGLQRSYFVAKLNANFPGNPLSWGLPTIQGIVMVCDATDGRMLSLMDSIELTIIRTGAATGVAAKYLACDNARTVTICGCGNQGRISLKALMAVRQFERVYAFDINPLQTEKFIAEFGRQIEIESISEHELSTALRKSQVVVTCTTSHQPFVRIDHIQPGTFIAAVGADNPEKQELFPELLAASKIITDITEQSATIGELSHAIEDGLLTSGCIHADLGSVITGKKKGRESQSEIIIFDSTGTALQDVAAAAIVYEKAVTAGIGLKLNINE